MSSRAIEAARAFVRIYADDAQLRRSLANLKPTLQATAEQFNGIGGNMALAGLTAAGGGLIMTAANAERTAIAFEVMLGSAGRAKQMLDEIYALGANSPFGADDFMQAGQVLLNFGSSADSVLPQLRMLGDIAAGDAEKLQRLTTAFGQVSATGRLMGGELNQFINSGFNPLQEMVRTTGESMTTLKRRMEAGGISFEDVAKAVQSATEKGGRFHGMTERLAGSTIGVWMTLKDEVMMLAKEMGGHLLPVVNGVLNLVRQMFAHWRTWGDQIVKTGAAAGAFLLVMKAITLATLMYTKVQALATALSNPKGWIVLGLALTAAAGAYVAIDKSMADVKATAEATHPPLETMSGDLADIAVNGRAAAAAFGDVTEEAKRADEIISGLKSPIEKAREEVQQFKKDLQAKLGMNVEKNPLVGDFAEQKSGFASMLEDINREIERLNGNATEASQKLADMGAIGVSPKQIEMLQSLIEKRDQLLKTEEEKQQRQKAKEDRLAEMQAAADDVKTAIETVQQSFAKEQQRLQTLVDAGMLSKTDADKFLAKNPRFAALMQGMNGEGIAAATRGNVAKDLRSAEGASQLYSLFNGSISNEQKQIALLTEVRDESRKARILAEKDKKAIKI